MLVDDVITAGTAIRESMEIIRGRGAQLAGVLISRSSGTRPRRDLRHSGSGADYGCRVISIITLKELIAYPEEKPEMAEHRRQFAPIVKPTASDDAPGSLGCRISAISA